MPLETFTHITSALPEQTSTPSINLEPLIHSALMALNNPEAVFYASAILAGIVLLVRMFNSSKDGDTHL